MAGANQTPPWIAAVAEFLDVGELRTAIYRACGRAKRPHWTPYQLRHNAATRVARELGVEHARAVLGHSDVAVTRRYSVSADVAIAAAAAAKLG